MMTQEITLFGNLEIRENDRLSDLMKYSKGCALLVYLIITKEPINRVTMANLLWDTSSDKQSLRNLRKLLVKLRPLCPQLQVTRQHLTYQPDTAVTIDLYTLESALAAQEIDLLNANLRLYSDELLHGFYLDDAPPFNEWLTLLREQWRHRVWEGYRFVCTAYDEKQAWKKGGETALRWLKLDDFNEEALRYLVRFLAADGQIESALKQYNLFCQNLWDELAVEPEPATVDLVAMLNEETEAQSSQEVGENDFPAHIYLPYQRNPSFRGREPELLQLAEVLLPSQNRMAGLTTTAVVTGEKGIGKTELAVEFAYRYGRFYAGGIYWVNFSEEDNLLAEIGRIGGEAGMQLYQTIDNLSLSEQAMRVQNAWQESIPRLLIFDGCEDENLFADWLPVSGGCRVLLTSTLTDWPREIPLTILPLTNLR